MMTIRCVLVALLATAALAAPDVLKDGSCPPNDVIGICVVPDNACIGDGQCPGDEKCCSSGCNRVCLPPVKDEDCEELECLEEARETCPNGVVTVFGCPTCQCQDEAPFCTRALCPVGTRCDDALQACVPLEACPPVCAIFCEFGKVLDANGCETCECNPDPCRDANCPTGTGCVVRLIAVQCIRAPCPSIYQAECVDPKVSCRPLRCPACRAGHVMVDGCPTCKCINLCAAIDCAPGYTCDENTGRCEQVRPRCPPVRCDATCQLTLDENDCEICSCSRDPCVTQICRRNYHCEVTRGDQARCVPDLDSRRRPSV